ncbi:MAG TPA: hypothetical protein VGI97_14635 [Gemmatimonadaceae bacterium]|jgi:hypothetical protein
MTRNWGTIFLRALVAAFVAEHIFIITANARDRSPMTVDGPTCVVKVVKS